MDSLKESTNVASSIKNLFHLSRDNGRGAYNIYSGESSKKISQDFRKRSTMFPHVGTKIFMGL